MLDNDVAHTIQAFLKIKAGKGRNNRNSWDLNTISQEHPVYISLDQCVRSNHQSSL